MKLVSGVFLAVLVVTQFMPAVTDFEDRECDDIISGCGESIIDTDDTECCECREGTSQSCNLTVSVFCLLESVFNPANLPVCCPDCLDWEHCVSMGNKIRLIVLFGAHDKIIEILNCGRVDNTMSETLLRKALEKIVRKIHVVLDDINEECSNESHS